MITPPVEADLCTHLYRAHHVSREGVRLHCRLAIRFGEQGVSYWPVVEPLLIPGGYGPNATIARWLILPVALFQMQQPTDRYNLVDRILLLGAQTVDVPAQPGVVCFARYVDMIAYLYAAPLFQHHAQATHPLRGELPNYIAQVIARWGDERVIRALLLCRVGEEEQVLPIRRQNTGPTLGLHPFLLRDAELLADLSVKARLWLLRQGEMQMQLYSLY